MFGWDIVLQGDKMTWEETNPICYTTIGAFGMFFYIKKLGLAALFYVKLFFSLLTGDLVVHVDLEGVARVGD